MKHSTGQYDPTHHAFHYEKQWVLIIDPFLNEVILKTSNFHFTLGFSLIYEMIYQVDLLV